MTADLTELADAIEFISADPAGESEAFLCLSTGKIYYRSPYTDDFETVPEDLDDTDKYLALPHEHEFHFGRDLVMEFVHEKAPSAMDEVYEIFRKRGAFSRFKRWADNNGLLILWHQYEEKAKLAAIARWCKDNDVKL